MSWKKLDDTVTAGNDPLDSFSLIGMESNANAARTDRPSSCGMAWPSDSGVTLGDLSVPQPIFACAQTVGIVLARWRVTPGFDSIDVRLHHNVVDAAVNFGLTLLTSTGPVDTTLDVQVPPGLFQKTTVTVSGLRQYWGETVTLLLLFKSEVGEEETSVIAEAEKLWNWLKLVPGHGVVLDPLKRYTVRFENDPAGLSEGDGDAWPLPVTLQWWRTTVPGDLYLYIWPKGGVFGPIWRGAIYIRFYQLGQSVLYGYSIRESSPVDYAGFTEALRPGRAPIARHIGNLYSNNRLTFENQARILHAGPVLDPLNVDLNGNQRCLWGPAVPHEVAPAVPDYQVVGSTLVGHYDHSVLDPSGDAVQQYRSKIIVEGYMLAVYASVDNQMDLEIDMRLRLVSFAAGAWSSNEVIGNAWTDIPIRARQRLIDSDQVDLTSEIWAFQQQDEDLAYSHLRWAFPIPNLRDPSMAGLTPFRLEITDTEVTAGNRLLLVEVRGHEFGSADNLIQNTSSLRPWYFCPTFTARIEQSLGVPGGGDGGGGGDGDGGGGGGGGAGGGG